jgi:regulatory protein
MLITDIRTQKRRSSYSLFINGDLFCEVDATTVAKLGLRKGMEVDEQLAKKLGLEGQLARCKKYAFDLLIKRSYSSKELSDKLKSKGFTNDLVSQTRQLLEKLGYLKDEKFAKEWVESRKRSRPKGKIVLERELLSKGIAKATVNRVLEDFDESEEREMASALAKKRLKAYASLSQVAARRRLFSYLLRRGFSSEIVSDVMRELGV